MTPTSTKSGRISIEQDHVSPVQNQDASVSSRTMFHQYKIRTHQHRAGPYLTSTKSGRTSITQDHISPVQNQDASVSSRTISHKYKIRTHHHRAGPYHQAVENIISQDT